MLSERIGVADDPNWNLTVPLFARLVGMGVPSFLLNVQYRMHPAIAQFSSDAFYAGSCRCVVTWLI